MVNKVKSEPSWSWQHYGRVAPFNTNSKSIGGNDAPSGSAALEVRQVATGNRNLWDDRIVAGEVGLQGSLVTDRAEVGMCHGLLGGKAFLCMALVYDPTQHDCIEKHT